MRQRKKRSVYSRGGSDVGYGICACVGHEDSAGNPCRRTPDGVYGGRYFRETPHVLVLENIQDPGNLGTIFRTAEAAGATGIVLSKDCVDLYNPKVIRSTMGAIFRIPFIYTDDLKGTIDELKREGITVYAAHLKGENSYDMEDYKTACAFLIGNEGNGLTEETAACADRKILIPMEGGAESLNAAVASAVLMFEAGRQRRNKRK